MINVGRSLHPEVPTPNHLTTSHEYIVVSVVKGYGAWLLYWNAPQSYGTYLAFKSYRIAKTQTILQQYNRVIILEVNRRTLEQAQTI